MQKEAERLHCDLCVIGGGMAGVCAAMVLSALGYNFASGSREALAYESLAAQGRQTEYQR